MTVQTLTLKSPSSARQSALVFEIEPSDPFSAMTSGVNFQGVPIKISEVGDARASSGHCARLHFGEFALVDDIRVTHSVLPSLRDWLPPIFDQDVSGLRIRHSLLDPYWCIVGICSTGQRYECGAQGDQDFLAEAHLDDLSGSSLWPEK